MATITAELSTGTQVTISNSVRMVDHAEFV